MSTSSYLTGTLIARYILLIRPVFKLMIGTRAQAIFFWTLIVRQITCCFEGNPQLRPSATPLGQAIDTANYKRTALSSAQATQIKEIFELFDTDGGGNIDRKELQFAMTALGFQTKEHHHRREKHEEAMEVMNDLIGDGKVTLEEFTALMTGELTPTRRRGLRSLSSAGQTQIRSMMGS